MHDQQCVDFLRWALPHLGLRWAGFRKVRRQVCKRVGRRLAALQLADLDAYRTYLATDEEEWRVLDAMARIPISRFWRDRATFDRLADEVLPRLARQGAGQPVRCWSLGGASGEEPYSLALAWAFAVPAPLQARGIAIVVSEADPALIERARSACYGAGSLKDLPASWRAQAFVPKGALWCLKAAYRGPVTFRHEDIRRSMPEGPFDLVLCRNLAFTYFDENCQREIVAGIFNRLRAGGVLALGRHESLPSGADGFSPDPGCRDLYVRVPN